MPTETQELRTVLRAVGQTYYQAQMHLSAAATASVGVAAKGAAVEETALTASATSAAAAHQGLAAGEAEAAAGAIGLQAALGPVGITLAIIAVAAAAAAAGIAAVGGGTYVAARAAARFETELTDLEAQAGYSNAKMQEIHDTVLSLDSALDQADLVGALKPFAFAGQEADMALQGMLVSAQAAEAYATDANAVANALLVTTTAYNAEAEQQTYIMDVLAMVVAKGRSEFDELALYMPRVITQAASASTSFEDMAASLTAISFFAGNARLATGMLQTMYRALAMEGYSAQLSQEGLLATLRGLMEQTGGNRAELQKLLGTAEAVDTVVNLSTDDFAQLRQNLVDVEDASGTVADALAIRRDSVENALQRVRKAASDTLIILGELTAHWLGRHIQALALAADAMKQYVSDMVNEQQRMDRAVDRSARRIEAAAAAMIRTFANLARAAIVTARTVALVMAALPGGPPERAVRRVAELALQRITNIETGMIDRLYRAQVRRMYERWQREQAGRETPELRGREPAPPLEAAGESARIAAIRRTIDQLQYSYGMQRRAGLDAVKLAQAQVMYARQYLHLQAQLQQAMIDEGAAAEKIAAQDKARWQAAVALARAEDGLAGAKQRAAEQAAREAEKLRREQERAFREADRERLKTARDMQRIGREARTVTEALQFIVGGFLGPGLQEALGRIGGAALRGIGTWPTLRVMRAGDREIRLRITPDGPISDNFLDALIQKLIPMLKDAGEEGMPAW